MSFPNPFYMEWYPEHFLWNCTPVNAKEPHRLSGQHWFRQCLSAIRHQAITWVTEPSHYLSWCWPKSMSPYGVKKYHLLKGINFVEALMYWLHNGLSSTILIISFAIPSSYFTHEKNNRKSHNVNWVHCILYTRMFLFLQNQPNDMWYLIFFSK